LYFVIEYNENDRKKLGLSYHVVCDSTYLVTHNTHVRVLPVIVTVIEMSLCDDIHYALKGKF